MFRRTESSRERALLNLIGEQQRIIRDLNDRLMYLGGQSWNLPPHPENIEGVPEYVPPTWTANPEQGPVY